MMSTPRAAPSSHLLAVLRPQFFVQIEQRADGGISEPAERFHQLVGDLHRIAADTFHQKWERFGAGPVAEQGDEFRLEGLGIIAVLEAELHEIGDSLFETVEDRAQESVIQPDPAARHRREQVGDRGGGVLVWPKKHFRRRCGGRYSSASLSTFTWISTETSE